MVVAHFSGNTGNTISFAQKLAESPRFKTLFRDGMDLVEEVATYLDGQGREDAKSLNRSLALAYAAESMRLTTRLMQIASWLLVQRAVNEGEMTQDQAAAEKHKVRLSVQDVASGPDLFAKLPEPLRELTMRSLRLQDRIIYLDRSIQAPRDMPVVPVVAANELGRQWEKIRKAFPGGR